MVKLKAADARAALIAAGFSKLAFTSASRAPASDAESFTLESQQPAAGTKVPRSTAITLAVFGDARGLTPTGGPNKLRIPDGLAGLTENEAKARLMAAGFTSIGIVSANDPKPDSKAGTVEQHVPLAGEVERGTTVTLYIFPKPGEAIVPYVLGYKVSEAKLQIEGVKLKTALTVSADPPPDEKSQCTVQAQSHAQGEKLKHGEVVTLSIYPKFGTPMTGVPNLVGLSFEEAQAALATAKLQLGGYTALQPPKNAADAEKVAGQLPVAGAPLPADKLVAISVWGAMQTVSPPPVAPPAVVVPMINPGGWVGTFRGTISFEDGGPAPATFTFAQRKDGDWDMKVSGNYVGALKSEGNIFSGVSSGDKITIELKGDSIIGLVRKLSKGGV